MVPPSRLSTKYKTTRRLLFPRYAVYGDPTKEGLSGWLTAEPSAKEEQTSEHFAPGYMVAVDHEVRGSLGAASRRLHFGLGD